MRILIVDDHVEMMSLLGQIVEQHPKMTVIGYARNGLEALKIARREDPDVILMDIGMPVMNGIETTRIIHTEMPETKVLSMAIFYEPGVVRDVAKAGASGFLVKDRACDDLVFALNEVAHKHSFFPEEVSI